MCKAMEDLWRDGIREGSVETMQATARRMVALGKYALEEISLVSGLSLDEVRRLSAPGTA